MRFVIDAQLPPALARWLAAQGHEAEHVGDQQMLSNAYSTGDSLADLPRTDDNNDVFHSGSSC